MTDSITTICSGSVTGYLAGIPGALLCFTGIPRNGEYPEDVHTSVWALTNQNPAGGLVDGPVFNSIYSRLKGIQLYSGDEFAHLQNEYVVYHDDIGDYATNEPTMDGTAGAILFMAYLGTDSTVDRRPSSVD